MGDRYTITADHDALQERFEVEIPDRYAPRYNAAPTQILPVITQNSKGLSFFYWGQIPEWSKNKTISPKLIYAESESILEKATTKKALSAHRCIVPLDGFYGWKKVSKKGKIPHRFIFGDKGIRSCPAIWEEFEDEEGHSVQTFKLITIAANKVVGEVSDRMPIIFEKEQEKIYLSDSTDLDAIIALFQPYPNDKMGSYTVSPQFSNTENEGPALIKPFAPADQFGNYSLFD